MTNTSEQNEWPWLRIDELCERLGLSKRTLYRMWQDQEGPRFSQLGAQRLVRVDWLEDWLLSNEVVA